MTASYHMRVMGPKSRSGCLVCRKRHIKCDETRPSCNRCQKGRYRCEYDFPPSRNGSTLKIIRYAAPPTIPPSSLPNAELNELRALDYFRCRAAPDLGGVCSGDLWTKFLLPCALNEAAVRHALIALGTAHESFVRTGDSSFQTSDFGLRQYGRALAETVQLNATTRPEAVEIALATSVIFASLDSLRGYPRSVLHHVQAGLRMLTEAPCCSVKSSPIQIPRYLIQDVLLRFEAEVLNMGEKELAREPSKPEMENLGVSYGFTTSEEALQATQMYHNGIQRFFMWANSVIPGGVPSLEVVNGVISGFQEFKALQLQLKESVAAFCREKMEHPESIDPRMLILKILEAGYDVMLNIDRNKEDCAYDEFTTEFQTIVDCAETYLQLTSRPLTTNSSSKGVSLQTRNPSPKPRSRSTPGGDHAVPKTEPDIVPKPEVYLTPSFSLSSGIIPNLFLAASRCRDPTLRRHALRLLRTCNRREGIWDSRATAQVAARLIEIEEATALQLLKLKLGKKAPKVIDSMAQIPLTARVGMIGIKLGFERSAKATYLVPDPENEYSKTKILVEDISW